MGVEFKKTYEAIKIKIEFSDDFEMILTMAMATRARRSKHRYSWMVNDKHFSHLSHSCDGVCDGESVRQRESETLSFFDKSVYY